MKEIKNRFNKFIKEIKLLNDTENVKFELEEYGSNFIIISGKISQIITENKIRDLSQKYNFQIMANEFARPIE